MPDLVERVDELERIARAVPRTRIRPVWHGNAVGQYIWLAVLLDDPDFRGGAYSLMDFRRWGMRGGQPAFLGPDHCMHDAKEHLTFEVGDQSVRGYEQAKLDRSVYRYDISGVDNAWARMIAAGADSGLLLDLIADWRRLREMADEHTVERRGARAEGGPA